MPEGLVDPSEPLDRQNVKLRRIAEALMDRVERDTNQTGNAFSLFQRAIALEDEVKARTRDLQTTLDELKIANQKLAAASAVSEEANRAKSRFVAAASHDVRQPLNAAKLFLASLTETGLSDDQTVIGSKLSNAFQSVEYLLSALLEISRLDSSSIQAETTRFPVARILDPLIHEFVPLATRRELDLRHVSSSAWVESDPYYLRQIVQNILANAIQYTMSGRVLVGCRRRGDRLFIEVHDTGPGIAADEMPLVWEEFRRLPRAMTDAERAEGAGLGLAIVKRASDLLGHSLDIASEPGFGTRFSIGLPMCAPEQTPVTALDIQGESAETLIALVISQDMGLVDQSLALMEQWGAGGMHAATLDEAYRVIDQLGMFPDAVLLDAATPIDTDRLAVFLETATNVAVLQGDGDDGTPLPQKFGGLPRLARPLQPHRLRAVLFRGAIPAATEPDWSP